MYQAEMRGKLSRDNENKEDFLTSNVFSFFKYANRDIFLYALLRSFGFSIRRKDAQEAEFRFWPRFEDGTEPDLIIIVGDLFLLIESKFFSRFGERSDSREPQLVREIMEGRAEAENLGKDFYFIAVTADYFKPEIEKKIPQEIKYRFLWVNWHRISFFLFQTLEKSPDITFENRAFAEDLYELLRRKNLRKFEGIRALSLTNKLDDSLRPIFFSAKTAIYRGDFIGFTVVFRGYPKNKKLKSFIFFILRKNGINRFFFGFQGNQSARGINHNCPENIFFSSKNKGKP